jgi:predicted nucleic acid-binding Zn ribbon protein
MNMVDTKKVKENIQRMTNRVASSTSGKVQPHKHCRVCFRPIKLTAEPRVCSDQACIDRNIRDEKNERQMRIWMFVVLGIFAFSFLGPMLLRML